LVSSFAFVPLFLKDTLGVLMLEFSDHHKLDEFLIITDSITLELSRFIASEKREKNLKRELDALANISEAAPMVLTCRTLDDLCDFIARLVADLMEAERVSVRVLGRDDETGKVSRFESTPDRGGAWVEEDDERFLKLKKKQQAFNLAFLNFAPDAGDRLPAYHSLLAAPIMVDDVFRGGIIAYDKRPANPLEDATFSGLDRSIIQHVVAIAAPAIRALSQPAAADGKRDVPVGSVPPRFFPPAAEDPSASGDVRRRRGSSDHVDRRDYAWCPDQNAKNRLWVVDRQGHVRDGIARRLPPDPVPDQPANAVSPERFFGGRQRRAFARRYSRWAHLLSGHGQDAGSSAGRSGEEPRTLRPERPGLIGVFHKDPPENQFSTEKSRQDALIPVLSLCGRVPPW
jgi:hypothetical protein